MREGRIISFAQSLLSVAVRRSSSNPIRRWHRPVSISLTKALSVRKQRSALTMRTIVVKMSWSGTVCPCVPASDRYRQILGAPTCALQLIYISQQRWLLTIRSPGNGSHSGPGESRTAGRPDSAVAPCCAWSIRPVYIVVLSECWTPRRSSKDHRMRLIQRQGLTTQQPGYTAAQCCFIRWPLNSTGLTCRLWWLQLSAPTVVWDSKSNNATFVF